jgi:hypothetical protein
MIELIGIMARGLDYLKKKKKVLKLAQDGESGFQEDNGLDGGFTRSLESQQGCIMVNQAFCKWNSCTCNLEYSVPIPQQEANIHHDTHESIS